MKQFFKYFFASVLGTFSAIFLLGVLLFFFILAVTAMIDTEDIVTISPNTILELDLKGELPERSYFDPIGISNLFSTNLGKRIGLNDVIQSIEKAKEDNNISGIYLKLDDVYAGGYAIIDPIRKTLLDFKRSGKFVIAHGNIISQKAYYLSTAADSIYLTPTGYLEFKGLHAELTFFKKTLDKLDIDAQIIRAGKFKSAVEPFISDRMSKENRLQIKEFINSINNHILSEISVARGVKVNILKGLQDELKIQSANDAKKYHLVNDLKYEIEVEQIIKSLSHSETENKFNTVSLRKYVNVEGKEKPYSSNRIAVIYAVGDIVNTKGNESTIGKENIVRALRKAKENSRVKAIVMRVNSPGGLTLISDIIWKEVELAKKEKPLVVSFSSLAASAGYHISCPADSIVAEPLTLTGSIGVFAIIPNTQKFFDNKLGITFDRVTTGKYSDFISGVRPLSTFEKQILEKQVDTVYSRFINNVSSGRKMSVDDVDKIGQGRIWSGIQAKELGLVDELGGLNKAIQIAADLSEINNYRIVEYPEIRDPFEVFFESLYDDAAMGTFNSETKKLIEYYSKTLDLIKGKEVYSRLPFEIELY